MNLEILHFVFEGPSSVRPEHEGSSSFYEGLPDLDTKRPYLRTTFFEDVKNFEADQIQSGLCFIQNTWRCI